MISNNGRSFYRLGNLKKQGYDGLPILVMEDAHDLVCT